MNSSLWLIILNNIDLICADHQHGLKGNSILSLMSIELNSFPLKSHSNAYSFHFLLSTLHNTDLIFTKTNAHESCFSSFSSLHLPQSRLNSPPTPWVPLLRALFCIILPCYYEKICNANGNFIFPFPSIALTSFLLKFSWMPSLLLFSSVFCRILTSFLLKLVCDAYQKVSSSLFIHCTDLILIHSQL